MRGKNPFPANSFQALDTDIHIIYAHRFHRSFSALLLILILNRIRQAKAYRSQLQHGNHQKLNMLKIQALAYTQNRSEKSNKRVKRLSV